MKKHYHSILLIIGLLFTLNLYAIEKTYYVKGMTCGSCVQSITTELKKHTEIESVSIDLDSSELKIKYKKNNNSPLTDTQIKDALENAGGYELIDSPAAKKNTQKTKKKDNKS